MRRGMVGGDASSAGTNLIREYWLFEFLGLIGEDYGRRVIVEKLIGSAVVAENLVAWGLISDLLRLNVTVLVGEGSVKERLNRWPEVNVFEERRVCCRGHSPGRDIREAHIPH